MVCIYYLNSLPLILSVTEPCTTPTPSGKLEDPCRLALSSWMYKSVKLTAIPSPKHNYHGSPLQGCGVWWHALNCCHVCCQGDCSRMCNVNSHYAHLFSTLQGRYHHRFSLGSLAITAAPWWIQRVSQNVVLTEFLLLLLWSSRMERILKESHGAWWGWRKFWWCCCLIVKDGEDIDGSNVIDRGASRVILVVLLLWS